MVWNWKFLGTYSVYGSFGFSNGSTRQSESAQKRRYLMMRSIFMIIFCNKFGWGGAWEGLSGLEVIGGELIGWSACLSTTENVDSDGDSIDVSAFVVILVDFEKFTIWEGLSNQMEISILNVHEPHHEYVLWIDRWNNWYIYLQIRYWVSLTIIHCDFFYFC